MGLFSFGKKSNDNKINWVNISSVDELNQAIADTQNKAGVFFKHSTRCSISSMALSRFESQWEENENIQLYFIDLIANRDVSNLLSELSGVMHQSPQVIVIQNEKEVYNASHNGISASEIKNAL
ncbi:bacillithiol system redox-active protein YtxJ [Brumimicrobium aurantiacum]|uniref:Bacillithiol system redox-active protein YtxJ n=1 Tax=Brumimicrobium aurantiacum TaxID=1737063 RepID=A0A3E1EX71_9FLAO|nr:bacillithiol system redox-active protein YtxJ [Brumimicrobium aurantiacum]RFC54156.1 bacillithiol system redox-active protein YtxJ [Brumimicrobium aurantiacum]